MTFDDAALQVLPYVAGCPADLIARAMRDATIEFCKKSQCLVSAKVIFTTGIGFPDWDYAFEQIVDVIEARIDNAPIPVLRLNDPLADVLDDGVYCVRFVSPNELSITPELPAGVSVELVLVTAPGPQASAMHESVWMSHHRALRDGALAELYEIPNRAWSNLQLSTYHRGKFDAAIKNAQSEIHRNVTKPARRLRVKPA